MKALVICMCNLNRSPTVAKFLKKKYLDWEVKSTGTEYAYDCKISQELLDWADRIFIMDIEQEYALAKRFKNYENKITLLGIGDIYDRDDKHLIEMLEWKFGENKNDIA